MGRIRTKRRLSRPFRWDRTGLRLFVDEMHRFGTTVCSWLSCRATMTALFGLLACISCDALVPSASLGRVFWRAEGVGSGVPAFDDSTVFFVGMKHELIAINKFDGSRRWAQFSGDGGGPDTRGTSAVVVGSVVAMGDLDIHAFDRTTGARRWAFHPQDGYYPGVFTLATDGRVIYAGSPSGRVYAVDGATGQPNWTAVVANDDNTSVLDPTVHDGIVYVCVRHFTNPITGGVVALDASSGAQLWARDFPPEPPLQHSGCNRKTRVSGDLVVGVSAHGYAYGMDRLTGEIRWAIPRLSNLPPGAPMTDQDIRPLEVHGSVLVLGSSTGYVAAFDISTQQELWRARADRGSVIYPLGIDAQNVFALHLGGQLAAFSVSDGKLLWLAGDGPNGGQFSYSPVVDDSLIYIGGYNGLYALRIQ